jgi:replicative DNA helicase
LTSGTTKKSSSRTEEPVSASNIYAERAVLGALIRNESTYWHVAGILRRDQFAVDLHQKIFGVIADICEEGKRLSLTLMLSRLPDADEKGTMMDLVLHGFMKAAEEVTTPLDFAEQISEAANLRQLRHISESLSRAVKSGDRAAIDIAGEAELAILDVMHISAPKRPRKLGEAVKGTLAAAFRSKETDFLPGLNTGLSSLDEVLGLIMPGDLGGLLGAQGDGKTALAMQIAMHNASLGRPSLIFQLEMTEEQQAARELAKASGISVQEINEGAFDFNQANRLKDAEEQLQQPDMYIIDPEDITVRQIRAHCIAMKRSIGLALVVIDQLDKIKVDGWSKTKFDRFEQVTKDLKNLAKSLGVPIILLAQRTRTAQRNDDPTPRVLDAEAPSLEKDCDWLIAVWQVANWLRMQRPAGKEPHEIGEWQSRMSAAEGRGDVICLKRRRGKAFEQRPLRWNGPMTRFEEMGEKR